MTQKSDLATMFLLSGEDLMTELGGDHFRL